MIKLITHKNVFEIINIFTSNIQHICNYSHITQQGAETVAALLL